MYFESPSASDTFPSHQTWIPIFCTPPPDTYRHPECRRNPTFLIFFTSSIGSCDQSSLLENGHFKQIHKPCILVPQFTLMPCSQSTRKPISFKLQNIIWIQTTSHIYYYHTDPTSLWGLTITSTNGLSLCLCFLLPTVEEFLLVLIRSWHSTDLLKILTWIP